MENPTVCIVDGVLYVNTENRALAEHPDRLAYWQHKKGFWSTDDPSHPFFHATGHESHQAELIRRFRQIAPASAVSGGQRAYYIALRVPMVEMVTLEIAEIILNEVGIHGLTTAGEFVAEVLAGLTIGKTYSEAVMERCFGFGGCEV